MDEFSKILTDRWKEIIESINVNGHSRKVESVNICRMNKYYNRYPEIEFCYKVTFDFEDGISSGDTHPRYNVDRRGWDRELDETFAKMFKDSNNILLDPWANEIRFENSKVDYMANQGHRLIVQFYPLGFLSEFRQEKLKELGI
jgi:hypothetical protein